MLISTKQGIIVLILNILTMVYISGGNQLLDAYKILQDFGIHDGMRVADLGCGGAGHFILPSAVLAGSEKVYAVDILRSVLEEVAKKARHMAINNLKTIWANLEIYGSTGLPDDFLDAAYLINVLFQSKEHLNIFKESKRILKPAGRLLVIDWSQEKVPFGPPIIDRIKTSDIKSIAQELDLKLNNEFKAGKYHFGLIFEK